MSETINPKTPIYNRAKTWQIGLFSMNNLATNLYMFLFTFVTYYSTGIMGLATLLAANLMGAARFFDGAIDPTIGVLMDKTDTKFGKYRPFMVVGNITLAFSVLLLFNTHQFSGALQTVIFIVALVIHKIGYSLQATVTKAAQTALTNDPAQRPVFTIFDTIGTSILLGSGLQVFVASYLTPKHGGFTLGFFQEYMTIVIVLSAICTVLAIIGIAGKDKKEFFGLGENTVETKGIKEYWSIFKENKDFQVLAVSAGLSKLLMTLMMDSVVVVILFSIILGNYELSGTMSVILIVPQLIAVAIMTRVSGKKGMRFSFQTSLVISAISFAALAVILVTTSNPGEIFGNGWGVTAILFTIFYILARIFGAFPASLQLTMAADVSDYETSRSGRYVSGMIGTVLSFVDSLASSLAPVLIGFIMAAIGYTNGYPEVGDPLTREAFVGGLVLFIGLPLILSIITFVLMQSYSLTKEKMESVQFDIQERKNSNSKPTDVADSSVVLDIPIEEGAEEAPII